MKPRIKVLTLGVDDLERSLRFYREGLGLETEGIIGTEFVHGSVVFFDLEGGLKLALYPRKSLAHDSTLPLGPPSVSIGMKEPMAAALFAASGATSPRMSPRPNLASGSFDSCRRFSFE